MDATKNPLNPRQQRFVEEFVRTGQVGGSYARAGYRARGNAAEAAGSRLLRNVKVSEKIAELRAAAAARAEVAAADVIRDLARVGLADIGQVLDFSGPDLKLRDASAIPEDARRALAAVKVRRFTEGRGEAAREVEIIEFRLANKVEALDKLARYFGLYGPGRHEHSGPGGAPISHEHVINYDDPDRLAEIARLLAEVDALPPPPSGNGAGAPAEPPTAGR
jgi:phage terminase small subunit